MLVTRNPIDYFSHRRISLDENQFQGVFHAHLGVEILIVHEGQGTIIVDQRRYEIKPGMICIFQPYQLHHVQTIIKQDQPFIRSVIAFEPTQYDTLFENWPALHSFFRQLYRGKTLSPQYYKSEQIESLSDILSHFNPTIAHAKNESFFEQFSLFLVVFLQRFKSMFDSKKINVSDSKHVRVPHQAERIMKWIEEHYREALSLQNMSKDLHLSTHHLSHLFKESTGVTISDYLTAKRMQQAIALLHSSDYSISRIAEEVGITNTSYFCKLFKKHFGSTPYQFQKDIKGR